MHRKTYTAPLCQFGLDPEPGEDFFVLYDYKDWYPNEVGINIPSLSLTVVNEPPFQPDGCSTITATNPGSFPNQQPIATSYLLPNSDPNVPFQTGRRFATPIDVWSIEVADYEQNYSTASSGVPCSELEPDESICSGSDACHGTFDISPCVGFGTLGNDNTLASGDRTVEENHPCRNRLFVQGVFEGGSPGDKTYSVQMSEPGSDNFETATYRTFNGNSADIIENSILGGYDIGSVSFAGGSASLDPNPPSDGTGQYETGFNFVTEQCFCFQFAGTIINLGRIQTVSPSAINGKFGFRNKEITNERILRDVDDSFVEIGDPQFSFP